MDPLIEEARRHLRAADELGHMPFAQRPGHPVGLEQFERRDREVLQCHIRAMIAAAGALAAAAKRLAGDDRA